MFDVPGSEFIDTLVELGVTRFSGVPCSSLRGLFQSPKMEYIPAPHEGLAYAWAVGAHLAGRPTGVIVQNSGICNLMNALTSLAVPCRVPVFSIVSLRGWPLPEDDEMQHAVMGRIAEPLLHMAGAKAQIMDARFYRDQLTDLIGDSNPVPRFLLVPKDLLVWDEVSFTSSAGNESLDMTAKEVVRVVAESRDFYTPIFATTGYTSRYLASFGDLTTNFYMQGSMGHVPALAAGFASASGKSVVILDGDGALTMHPGAMSLIGGSSLSIVHLVINNGTYASTGSQSLPMEPVWQRLAEAYHYDEFSCVDNPSDLKQAYDASVSGGGSRMIIARTNEITEAAVPRASSLVTMSEMFARFFNGVGP